MTDSSQGPASAFLSAIVGGGNNNPNSSSMPRTIGTTASVGLSLVILRFVVSAVKAAAEDSDGEGRRGEGKARDVVHELFNRSEVLYQFVRTLLRRIILLQGNNIRGGLGQDGSNDEEGSEEDNVPMIHKGSCHCRAVCFEVSQRINPCKVFEQSTRVFFRI